MNEEQRRAQQRARARKRQAQRRKQAQQKKQSTAGRIVSGVVLVVALCVFAFSAFNLYTTFAEYGKGGKEYEKVQDIVIKNPDAGVDDEEPFSVDFEKLLELNADTVGWIRFDEPAAISYPVVQGRDNEEYLYRTFQANDNKLGTLFIDVENQKNFTDKNTIIYGHNLKVGGEMFSQLPKYEEKSFRDEHPYFYIYTPDGRMSTYEVFAAGVVEDISELYKKTYNTPEEFQAHLDLARAASAYETDVKVSAESQTVMLSTCTNVRDEERFVVLGVKIDERDVKGR